MSMLAIFKCNDTGTWIRHSHESQSLAAHLPVAFVEIVPVPSALVHISHVPKSLHSKWTFWDSCTSLNTLWASSMLPHLAYMSTKLLPTKTSALQPLWMICSWVCLLSSIACKLAHAFRVSYTCKSWQSLHLLGGGFNANFDLTHYGWYCNLSEIFHGSAITLHAFECLL